MNKQQEIKMAQPQDMLAQVDQAVMALKERIREWELEDLERAVMPLDAHIAVEEFRMATMGGSK